MKIKISTRVVLLIGKYAIKIPIDKRGYLQGKNESKIWEQYNRHCNLAPLLWEKFGIVCQRRCEPLEQLSASMVTEMKGLIPQFNFKNCDLYNIQNWGWYNNSAVLVDYGVDEKISKMYKQER